MTNEDLCLRYQAGDTDAAEELVSRNNSQDCRAVSL